MGISYVVLPNKFDPRYINESMADYTIEKCSILTYFGNKLFLKNKKNAPAPALNFQKRIIN